MRGALEGKWAKDSQGCKDAREADLAPHMSVIYIYFTQKALPGGERDT